MPVYNAGAFLAEAIESVLNQTFRDFEFIIINDGSTDNSNEIILSYNDARIKVINNPVNLGLIKTLNNGLLLAKGEYIARIDADDIAINNRFKKQIDFLGMNPDYGIVGTNAISIDEEGNFCQNITYPTTDLEIRKQMISLSPFGHFSVMIRKSVILKNNIHYNEQFKHAEDYAFWVELAKHTKLYNLNEFLMKYRNHSSSISVKFKETQQKNRNLIREVYLNEILHEENILKDFYKSTYLQRVNKVLLYKKKFPEKFNNYEKNLLELMYLDALETTSTYGISTPWLFSKLSLDKRVTYILKHYLKNLLNNLKS
jgi:glycosyltransferase involved in cell wall biosynthesis